MTVSLTCRHCNVEIEAADENQLVTRVQAHARSHGRPHIASRTHIVSRLHRLQRRLGRPRMSEVSR